MNRPQAFLTTLALALAIPAMWTTLGPMRAPSGEIDFETPSLESKGRQTIDPYVDAATGVTFTAEPGRWGDEAVGLVRNNSTSACVEPADANQKLGTGRSNPTAAGPGLSGFAIRARFPGSPSAPMTVSVEFQTTANVPIRLRLFDASDVELASATEPALPAAGTCGFPGDPRARISISATSDKPVAYAIMDTGAETGRWVFVIDNFEFGEASSTDASAPSLLERVTTSPLLLVAVIACVVAIGVALVAGLFVVLARRRPDDR